MKHLWQKRHQHRQHHHHHHNPNKYREGFENCEGFVQVEGDRAAVDEEELNLTRSAEAPPEGEPESSTEHHGHISHSPSYKMPEVNAISKKKKFKKDKYKLDFNPYDAKQWFKDKNFQKAPEPEPEAPPPEPEPIYNMSAAEFQKLRTHLTVEDGLLQLDEIGLNLGKLDTADFIHPITRVCLLCVNTYTKPSYQLGVGPLNDGITCAAFHRYHNYFVYYLHNPKSQEFLTWLKIFLDVTTENLTVYYVGHGSQIRDKSGDEASGYDQVMVFDTGYIVDDDLMVILQNHTKESHKVLLINDCCHSGTLYDIPLDLQKAQEELPPNILQISSASDSQTAKQMGGLGGVKSIQGLFTFYFFTKARENPNLTPPQAVQQLSPFLRKFTQDVIISPTSPNVLTEPIFPPKVL